jgi:NAD(P)-dependent dehydrogenase (short-subunit alcohol dehydrogenase family)
MVSGPDKVYRIGNHAPPKFKPKIFSLVEKKVLIIGSNSGFGQEISNILEQKGTEIFTANRSQNLTTLNDYPLDLCLKDDILGLSEQFKRKGIFFDAIINCAGMAETPQEIDDLEFDQFERVIQTNLIGTYYAIKYFHKNMNKGAMFIQLSGGGASGPMTYLPAYSSSKAGVVRLIETLAPELEEKDLLLNCLGPGPIKSTMTKKLFDISNKKVENKIQEKVPGNNGYIDPIQTAECIAELLSPRFAGVTGKFFSSQWDNWSNSEEIAKNALENLDSFTLRRVIEIKIGTN